MQYIFLLALGVLNSRSAPGSASVVASQ